MSDLNVKQENGLAIFNSSDFGSLRGREEPDGTIWVVAKDVAVALEYPESSIAQLNNLMSKVPDIWKGRKPIMTPGGMQEMLVLYEQGLYFFLARSDKPRALPFQMWLANDVLPSIRKTGSYALPVAQPLSATYSLEDQLKAAKFIFASHNISGEMLTLALDSYFSAETGKSALKQGNVSIVPAKQELALNVTQIGLLLKPEMKADKVNKLLEELGLQTHEGQKPKWYWKPTAKGLEFGAVVEYTGKKHKTTGTPVNQVKWLSSIADFLQRYIDTESGEEE